jgi:hypothetical protein
VHAKSGRESEEWKNAIEAMDQLVWSVEPISTTEERRKLAAIVPSLVRRLVAGMQSVGTEAQAREHFLGELMRHHTVALDTKARPRTPRRRRRRSRSSMPRRRPRRSTSMRRSR